MKRTLLLLAGLVLATQTVLAAETKTPVGHKVDDFTLEDFRGTKHSLADYAKSKAVVIVFLGTECPLAKLYGPRLAELAADVRRRGRDLPGHRRQSAGLPDRDRRLCPQRRHRVPHAQRRRQRGGRPDAAPSARPKSSCSTRTASVRYWRPHRRPLGRGLRPRQAPTDYLWATPSMQLLAGKEVKTAIGRIGRLLHRPRAQAQPKTPRSPTRSRSRASCKTAASSAIARARSRPFAMTELRAKWPAGPKRSPKWCATSACLPGTPIPRLGHFRNDRSMPEAEKELIYQWAAAGAPEGDPADLPEPQRVRHGWTLPTRARRGAHRPGRTLQRSGRRRGRLPVLRASIPSSPKTSGSKPARSFPAAPPVVHHVLCFVQPPGEDRRPFDENGLGFLAAYVPGFRATPFPEGMAKYVPAGSKLIFQMHYTPVGKDMDDQSQDRLRVRQARRADAHGADRVDRQSRPGDSARRRRLSAASR